MELRLHVKAFGNRNQDINDLLVNAKSVFDTAGIRLNVKTENPVRDSRLGDIDLNTTELDDLRNANTPPPRNEIAVYFLNSINPTVNGRCFPGPLIIVTLMFTPWTLAHEIGHALRLDHRPDNESLMGTTVNVQYPPPDFSSDELNKIAISPLLFPDTLRFAMERDQVLNAVLPQEPDYDVAVQLGQEALPILAEIAKEEDVPVAAKAVYLAGRIGGAAAGEILSSAAAASQPRPIRMAAAAGAAFVLPPHIDPALEVLLRDDPANDYGIIKTALRSASRGVSAVVVDRIAHIANTTRDELLKKLARAAMELQM
jgi:hypothetical protein